MVDELFWKNKKVLITGHTGFKGSWLSIWLYRMGAQVIGYSLEPQTTPSLFELADIRSITDTVISDIRDYTSLEKVIYSTNPDVIFHMAAQALVRDSYRDPSYTYEVNIMGTVNLFEAINKNRDQLSNLKAIVNITTDKCYYNNEWVWGYKETDPLGGYDPYSSSKACSELITSSYRSSFFNSDDYDQHGIGIASARAGNVIGGGDWARERLIPDCIRSLELNEKVLIRNPKAIRPWQHVLEPLSGYLSLAEKLYANGHLFSEAWNFGPDYNEAKNVEWIVRKLCKLTGKEDSYEILTDSHNYHEANYLKLDCSKAISRLDWRPIWNIETALTKIIEWKKSFDNKQNLKDLCIKQISDYNYGE